MSCLINVEYLCGGELTFFKKVSLAGFTTQNKLFTKEIVFRYPTSSTECIEKSSRFGNLELKRLDEDLIKTLAKFNTVIVRDAAAKEFISNYVTSHTKIIDVETTTCEQE